MLTKIFIRSFRGMREVSWNIWWKTHIIGNNWSGKTHILDAIHLLSGAKNIYGNTKLENNDSVEVFFADEIGIKSFIISSEGWREQFFSQNKKLSRPKYQEALPFRTVYVSPFDMNILYFAPAIRREYLDDILSRAFSQFLGIKRDYERIMKQRNALLKKIREENIDSSQLDFWDKKFAETAYIYWLYRKKYLEYIQKNMKLYPDFFGKYDLELFYEGEWIYSEDPEKYICEFLKNNRQRDIFSGHTRVGPHRDDFGFRIRNSEKSIDNVAFFLSRGEMKMILLGLKILESNFIAEQTQKFVVLLVDDIFAELDEKNIILFLEIIIQHQIILTSQKVLPKDINPNIFTCINLSIEYNTQSF